MNNYNFNKYDLILNTSEYYDFQFNTDYVQNCSETIADKLIVDFTFDQLSSGLFQSTAIWSKAINGGVNAKTYGLTGLDNGVLSYTKDLANDPDNVDLETVILGSELIIPSTNKHFFMNMVTGYTGNFIYDIYQDIGPGKNYLRLKGGFLQGYYRLDGYNYQVLPNRYEKGYTISVSVRKDDSILVPGENYINTKYPSNKGMFLYFGTRAENKYWNQFNGNSSGDCVNSLEEYCTITKETDVLLELDNDYIVPLLPPAIEFKTYTNKFLIYGRGSNRRCDSGKPYDGLGIYTVCSFDNTKEVSVTVSGNTSNDNTFKTNGFLIYGRGSKRTCDSGRPYDGFGADTVCSYSGNTINPETSLDKDLDVYDNALGFRIRDDGSIGYRYLTSEKICEGDKTITKVKMVEGYTIPGLVPDLIWTNIQLKWKPFTKLDECDPKQRKGKLMVYVDCFLKHTFNDFPEFIGRRLNDLKEKQVGVPYNISLGGGTQGLLESITLDGLDPNDTNLIIEKNFAGTFIGDIKNFKIFNDSLNWCEIKKNC